MSTPLESRLAPARRRAPEDEHGADDLEADVARGQAAAVLGALGRFQLRLDVLARAQQDSWAAVTAQLEDLSGRLARLEERLAPEPPV